MTGRVADSGEALPDGEPPIAADMWAIARGCTEMLIGPVKASYSIILATLDQGHEMSRNPSPLKEPHLQAG